MGTGKLLISKDLPVIVALKNEFLTVALFLMYFAFQMFIHLKAKLCLDTQLVQP